MKRWRVTESEGWFSLKLGTFVKAKPCGKRNKFDLPLYRTIYTYRATPPSNEYIAIVDMEVTAPIELCYDQRQHIVASVPKVRELCVFVFNLINFRASQFHNRAELFKNSIYQVTLYNESRDAIKHTLEEIDNRFQPIFTAHNGIEHDFFILSTILPRERFKLMHFFDPMLYLTNFSKSKQKTNSALFSEFCDWPEEERLSCMLMAHTAKGDVVMMSCWLSTILMRHKATFKVLSGCSLINCYSGKK